MQCVYHIAFEVKMSVRGTDGLEEGNGWQEENRGLAEEEG